MPRFPRVVPICPWCREPGLHRDSEACLVDLRTAIRIARKEAPDVVVPADPIRESKGPAPPWVDDPMRRTRGKPMVYRRRDRCDLPPVDVTKKIS